MVMQQASRVALGVLLVSVSGCVAVSRTDGLRRVGQEVESARGAAMPFASPAGNGASDTRVAELLAAPLTLSAAVEVAFLRNPQLLDAYARLGLSQAEVVAASRIGNPVISGSVITGARERQVIGGIAQPVTDLLLLPARKRLAAGEYERTQHLVAATLLDLVRDTEIAWYRYVSAEQVRTMREAVTRSADTSAALAQRFFDAGNTSDLELTLNKAEAARARVATLRAAADARAAKYDLQQRMGLSGSPAWRTNSALPAPVSVAETPEALVTLAQHQRADLVAARQEVALVRDSLQIVRWWRWLGTVEVGVERERETDGRTLTGPTLALALPIFNQGQAGIARAEAQLEQSRARLLTLETSVDNAVRLGLERVTVAQQVADEYRESLVPEHALIVKRQQERQNFMFIGQFELLLSKQQQYDTYQGYLEAVRDYWLARVDLTRAVGADLPSAIEAAGPAVGVDAILQAPVDSTQHGGHHHPGTEPATPPTESERTAMPDMPGKLGVAPPVPNASDTPPAPKGD